MRLPRTILTALVLATAPHAVQAQSVSPLTINLTPDTQSGTPGSEVIFSGTLTNTSANTISLDSISFDFAGNPFTGDTAPFNNVPFTLGPTGSSDGSDTYSGQIFGVNILSNASPGDYSDNFATITGNNPDSSVNGYGSTITFTVIVNAAPAPEPATLLTFGTGVAGVLGLVLRRGRKRSP